MLSNRTRPRALALALLAFLPRSSVAQGGSTPEVSPQASPAASDGPALVNGRYQLPDPPATTVIALSVGNPTTGEGTRFSFKTLERWLYAARAAPDPIAVLAR